MFSETEICSAAENAFEFHESFLFVQDAGCDLQVLVPVDRYFAGDGQFRHLGRQHRLKEFHLPGFFHDEFFTGDLFYGFMDGPDQPGAGHHRVSREVALQYRVPGVDTELAGEGRGWLQNFDPVQGLAVVHPDLSFC